MREKRWRFGPALSQTHPDLEPRAVENPAKDQTRGLSSAGPRYLAMPPPTEVLLWHRRHVIITLGSP